MREVLSGRGLEEKTQTPFIPYRIPTGVPMRVRFGIGAEIPGVSGQGGGIRSDTWERNVGFWHGFGSERLRFGTVSDGQKGSREALETVYGARRSR